LQTTRLSPSVEGLKSSLVQSDDESWQVMAAGIIYPGQRLWE